MVKSTLIHGIGEYIQQKKEVRDWKKKGEHSPPPHLVKQRAVQRYAKQFSIDTFVETGTYLGAMVYATRNTFSRIFSIELDKSLYEQARKKFSEFDHVSIIHGDSSEVLPSILANIVQPCLFWLDGHYSGGITARGNLETPIVNELHCILNHPIAEHVILIDDARLFIGQDDYPTIEELQGLILKRRPNSVFEVKNDIIRIHKV